MRKSILLILTSLMGCHPVFAGPRVTNNGGNVVSCYKGAKLQSAELLDFYEGRTLRQFQIQLDPKSTVQQNVEILLQRLEKLDPSYRVIYQQWADSFMLEALFLDNTNLVPIEDSYHAIFPSGCKVEQIATQQVPEFSQDRRYLINQSLWRKLDSVSQAGLILHEIFYRYLISLKPHETLNSIGIRYMVSVLAADSAAKLSRQDLEKMLIGVGLKESQVIDRTGEIIGRTWTYLNFNPGGFQETYTMTFPDMNNMVLTRTCQFSARPPNKDLTVSITAKVTLTSELIRFEEDKNAATKDPLTGATCGLFFKTGSQPYKLSADGKELDNMGLIFKLSAP